MKPNIWTDNMIDLLHVDLYEKNKRERNASKRARARSSDLLRSRSAAHYHITFKNSFA